MKRHSAIWLHLRRGLSAATLATSLSAGSLARAHEGEAEHEHESDDHESEAEHERERGDVRAHEQTEAEEVSEPASFATTPIHAPLADRHEALAGAALHRVPDSEHHFGLVMTVVERTSDLPWILAIENRGAHDVQLAALPSLLTLEVTPPQERAEQSDPSTTFTGQEPPAYDDASVHCGPPAPRSLSEEETLVIPPGSRLLYPFDAQSLCEDPTVLKEGSQVVVRYGFPTQTKKLWQKGKLVEVEVEQSAPFLAVDPRGAREETQQDALVPLKYLETRLPPLDFTYPLRALEQRVRSVARDAAGERARARRLATSPDAADPQVEDASTPKSPPLRVTLSPLGKTTQPEEGFIEVRIENVSSESLSLYLRREHLSYRILGPSGTVTCRMHPMNPSASTLSFSSLSPGESRNLTTRLAEACPAGVWGAPGEYVVAALFSPNDSGQSLGLDAYVGQVQSNNLARLTVLGGKKKGAPTMRVVHGSL